MTMTHEPRHPLASSVEKQRALLLVRLRQVLEAALDAPLDQLSQLALLLESRVPEAALFLFELRRSLGARALARLRLVPVLRAAVRVNERLAANDAHKAPRLDLT